MQRVVEFFAKPGELFIGKTRIALGALQGRMCYLDGFLQRVFLSEGSLQLGLQLFYALCLFLLKSGYAAGGHASLQSQAQVQRPVAVAIRFQRRALLAGIRGGHDHGRAALIDINRVQLMIEQDVPRLLNAV